MTTDLIGQEFCHCPYSLQAKKIPGLSYSKLEQLQGTQFVEFIQ